MKRTMLAVILLLVLMASFVAGILVNPAQAGRCTHYCDVCSCLKFRCCDGVCEVVGNCREVCPLVPCP